MQRVDDGLGPLAKMLADVDGKTQVEQRDGRGGDDRAAPVDATVGPGAHRSEREHGAQGQDQQDGKKNEGLSEAQLFHDLVSWFRKSRNARSLEFVREKQGPKPG